MKKKFKHVNILDGILQIPTAIKILLDTPIFIKDHKLWKGFFKHKWVFLFSIVVGFAFSSAIYHDLHDYFWPSPSAISEKSVAATEIIDEVKKDLVSEKIIGEDNELMDEGKKNSKHKSVFSGSLKFLLLIFLEVIIFHFAVTTNNILKSQNKTLVLKDFVKAEKRLLLIMGRNWVLGIIMYALVSAALGILGFKFLINEVMFAIYGFYLGFAFLDNYLEQFNFSQKKSTQTIQKHFGAALVFGIFASVTMNVPLIGPILVPFICAIAATRYGHQMKMENFEIPVKG